MAENQKWAVEVNGEHVTLTPAGADSFDAMTLPEVEALRDALASAILAARFCVEPGGGR